MHQKFDFKKKMLTQLVIGSLLATGINTAFAENTTDLGTVQSTAVDNTHIAPARL